MFKKSRAGSQLDLFTNTHSLLSDKAQKVYLDETEWHNQFRVQILEGIDEEIFRPLFADNFGAPNSSIKVLVSMMILKDALNLSESQLFDNCQFNIRIRSALGLDNMNDSVPVSSTYTLLRKRIVEWEKAGNSNLLEKVFAQVTKSQIAEFNINGHKIRMDSKILGSNIAWLSRYELVHETFRLAYLSLNLASQVLSDSFFTALELEVLKEILTETCSSVCYRSTDTQLVSKLAQLGIIIHKFLNHNKIETTEPIEMLRNVFEQQYEIVDSEIKVLPQERLSSDRIESPHDPDCRFSKKCGKKQKGYSINITETCDLENDVNLVTNVIVEPANTADNTFFVPAIEATQEIITQDIKTVNTDGAFYSVGNQEYIKKKEIDHVLSALGAPASQLDHSIDEDGNLTCIDTKTGSSLATRKVKSKIENSPRKWAVTVPGLKNERIITQHDVDVCKLRKQIAARSKEELNLRANVEATIFQLGYHYRANKSRYRGLIKHRMWAYVRCLWLNFVRIKNYIASLPSNEDNTRPDRVQFIDSFVFFTRNVYKYTIYFLVLIFVSLFCSRNSKYAHAICF